MDYKKAFSDASSQVKRTFLYSDMVGSKTLSKAGWSESDLYKRAGEYFDLCAEKLVAHGAERIRVEGDSIRASFDPANAHMAINAGIAIHEESEKRWGNEPNPRASAIGISTGSAVDLEDDYQGIPTVIARYMALSCSALGIVCCSTTFDQADKSKIASTLGSQEGRSSSGYFSQPQTLDLGLLPKPLTYHEVLWSREAVGLKDRAKDGTFKK